ncbi:DNA alkylation repair protein [Clostridium estertheticum]|uniref:DNA alkylation repair protein n=1 Tax=Clostridium estertheticum TaxID=238834 RepID=UPI0013E9636F|nr:DNA alkylation repair protein [Clostridium estertheticum]MBZ9689718.1 DNA alkylation repair protein [Clostridium estertheticum]
MINIVFEARNRLEPSSKENSLTTGKVRSISSALYKILEDKSIDNVFAHCEQLLNEHEWTLGVIAYNWAYRVRKQYNDKTFFVFEGWLKRYVTDWGDCDDFCTHAFGELLSQNNELFTHIVKWTQHPDFFVRRASAVVLIYPIKHNKYQNLKPFLICDALMNDNHHLVLKGYGWMLKVLSETQQSNVCQYLTKNKNTMPRVSFRYALEKLNSELKLHLMEE